MGAALGSAGLEPARLQEAVSWAGVLGVGWGTRAGC